MCSQKAFLYIFLINMTPVMRSIFRNLRLNAQQHSGLKGSDLFLRFLPFFPLLLLLLLLAVGLFSSYFHTWETSFTPYLVFSHCSNPNNEPTRHSKWGRKKKKGGSRGPSCIKLQRSISPVGYTESLWWKRGEEGGRERGRLAPLPPVIWRGGEGFTDCFLTGIEQV